MKAGILRLFLPFMLLSPIASVSNVVVGAEYGSGAGAGSGGSRLPSPTTEKRS